MRRLLLNVLLTGAAALSSTAAPVFNPLSTGITFAQTEKVRADRIPLITMGYGSSESVDGSVLAWNFPRDCSAEA